MPQTILPDDVIEGIADALWARLVGANFDIAEHQLKLRLAIEQKLSSTKGVPFGLDRLSTDDTAAYLGLQSETLRSRVKRRRLCLPEPYSYGRKMWWRRSELDGWIEQQRQGSTTAKTAA
jgi:predicted DNA-binding transcriptional regulator AlpA